MTTFCKILFCELCYIHIIHVDIKTSYNGISNTCNSMNCLVKYTLKYLSNTLMIPTIITQVKHFCLVMLCIECLKLYYLKLQYCAMDQ